MTRDWTDIDVQGRRINKIVKLCETNVVNLLKIKDTDRDNDLILAYMDRLIKASTHLQSITDMVLDIKMLRKLALKKHADQILEDKLKALS